MAFPLSSRFAACSGSLFRPRVDLLGSGFRSSVQPAAGLLSSSCLPARVLACSTFASHAGGGGPQGPPSSLGAGLPGGGPPVTTLASLPRATRPGLVPSPLTLWEFLAPHKMLNFAIQYILSFRYYFTFMARTTFQAVRPLLAFSVFGEVMKMVLATMSSGLFSFLFSFVLAFEVLYFFLQCYISYTFLTMFFTVMF
ncbi:hypothetical protein Efla_002861 [Eimeria flavescens]